MKKHIIEVVRGVEGFCVYINNYRVAGPKPWGGGDIVHEFEASESDVETAIKREVWTEEKPEKKPAKKKGAKQ